MNKTKWIIFAAVVMAIFAGVIYTSKTNQKTFTGDATKIITEGPIKDNVFGTDAQKVTVIEYGDYQCPGCGSIHQTIKDITTANKDKITFIFRNFPLSANHPNALAAATAAEAAGLQGKYYEMHDLLYEQQNAWSGVTVDKRASVFEGYASQLKLDIDKYKKDIGSKDISDKIARDRASGLDAFNVSSTPTFVINGTKVEGNDNVSAEILVKKINDALKTAYPDYVPPTVQAESTGTSQTQE